MAAVAKKVVRLEDLVPQSDERPESLLGDLSVAHNNNNSHKGPLVNTTCNGATPELHAVMNDSPSDGTMCTLEDDYSLPSQAHETTIALPEGWPRLEKLHDKHSWDYSTTIEPSVQKATAHLELLQTIIEEWFNEAQSRAQSATSAKKLQKRAGDSPAVKKQMHFRGSTRSSSTELSVLGQGAKHDEYGKHLTVVEPSPTDMLPYLGAEEVIEEVVLLLAKMETGRKDHLDCLAKERQRSEMLKCKIDHYQSDRMLNLPVEVQKEHEACAMDINELNWHVSYRGRIEHRNKNKVQVAETLNARLKEDITFVQGHIPLVKEKLELEVDAMERIRQAQVDTNEDLDITMQRFRKVDSKSSEAHTKAQQERSAIKNDLDTVRDDLQKITKELEEARKTHESYIHQCNSNRQQLQDNTQEIKVLLVKDENMKAAEAMQFQKVHQLESEIKKKEFEHRSLDDANIAVMTKIDVNTVKFTKKEKHMRDSIAEKEEVLRQLNRQNDELNMDIEDLNRKNADCNRQKLADEKNIERMKKELDKTTEQIVMTNEDLGNVSIINNAIREQLQNDEERCLQAEEALRTTTESLKKQVKEEIHTRTVLTARINSDGTELVQTQADVQIKKEMIDRKATEVENAVENVLKKVEKLRAYHREKTKVIGDMTDELKNVADAKKDIGDTCHQRVQDLVPPHVQLKEKVQKEGKKLENMLWKTDMMNKNIKEMDESAGMMMKAEDKTNKAIETLQADLEELNIQIAVGQRIEDGLRKDLTQAAGRVEDLDRIHKEHMSNRNNVLQEHESNLKENKELNTALATKYRQLQNQHVEVKQKMLNKFEERVYLENAVKDLKQLQGLQQRMHSALMEYFKYRGVFNQGELERMEDESRTNAVKVGQLQDQMDGALNKITFFLTHQLDGESIRKMAMEKVKSDERAESMVRERTVPAMVSASKPMKLSGVAVS